MFAYQHKLAESKLKEMSYSRATVTGVNYTRIYECKTNLKCFYEFQVGKLTM